MLLVGFFFVPLAVMVVFSLWRTNERLDIERTFRLDNYLNFFANPTYVRTLVKTLAIGAA